MAPTQDKTGGEVMRPVTRDSALAAYPGMVMAIPLGEDNDGSGIIADILMATSWDQLNGQNKLPAGKELVGRELKVTGMTRHESDQEGGFGWYLVVDAVDVRSGELVKFQTSAGALMATLVKLHALEVLPAIIEITSAVTGSGQTAIGCTVKAANGGKR